MNHKRKLLLYLLTHLRINCNSSQAEIREFYVILK